MFQEIVSHPTAGGLNKGAWESRLQKTTAEFESLLLNQMLKSMRKTISQEGSLGNTNEAKIINSMFDESLATVMAESGGIGLGKILFEQLKESYTEKSNEGSIGSRDSRAASLQESANHEGNGQISKKGTPQGGFHWRG